MKKIKVGIIGCGNIGSALAKIIVRDFRNQATLSYLCDCAREKAEELRGHLLDRIKIVPLTTLIEKSDFVIETASASIAARVANLTLARGKHVLIISVGGLLKAKEWRRLIRQRRGTLWIPSGAIAGIDGILAARESGIKSVKLVTQKPPAGLREAPYFRKKRFPRLRGRQECCVFRGSARQAVKAFPQNVNVAAVLSLAGIGPDKTQVEVWTSNAFKYNIHRISVESLTGTMRFEVHNLPSKNPKTSVLAIESTIAIFRKIFSPLHLGT